jgi:hypothetical protein
MFEGIEQQVFNNSAENIRKRVQFNTVLYNT